ncbi:D-glycero-beta-D-manno-heptose 1-phosphate adenylyltransferase [bacterium]|nr:D-glycero-beta-D-manno-heptose 1-phosphate adenylyltransferase [bacterium]
MDKFNRIAELKDEGKRIVFTNGCFDIIHRGHIEYLKKAKALGDILVIGLNSDASVCRIKGETRPIVPQEDRKLILESLRFVDVVIIFDEDTPEKLINKIKPDVLVKGADWKIDDIVGSKLIIDNGGEVVTIDFVEGKSTTSIIERILRTKK